MEAFGWIVLALLLASSGIAIALVTRRRRKTEGK